MPTEIERRYEVMGYRLPPGYTWTQVHQERAHYGIAPTQVPMGLKGSLTFWADPLELPPTPAKH